MEITGSIKYKGAMIEWESEISDDKYMQPTIHISEVPITVHYGIPEKFDGFHEFSQKVGDIEAKRIYDLIEEDIDDVIGVEIQDYRASCPDGEGWEEHRRI